MHSFGDNRLFLSKINRFYMIYKMLAKKVATWTSQHFPNYLTFVVTCRLSPVRCRRLVACPLSPNTALDGNRKSWMKKI